MNVSCLRGLRRANNTMMKELLFFLYVIMPFSATAMTIGSDTAVSRFNSNVTITNGQRVAGFAALWGGFTFAGGAVTGIFDSFFPVSGSIALNGGNLVLDRDLILNDVLSVGTLGTIYGNRHVIQMPVIDTLPTLTGAAFSCFPYFNNSIVVGNDAESISWSFDDQFLIVFSDDGLIRLYDIISNQWNFLTSFATGTAYNNDGQVAWRPSGYYFAMAHDHGYPGNPSVRTFSYNATSNVITQISTTTQASDCFACAWHPSGNFLAVGTNDGYGYGTTAQVLIYPVTSLAVLGTPVSYTLTNTHGGVFYESMAWDVTGNYLAVGLDTDGVHSELIVLQVTTTPLTAPVLNAQLASPIGQTVGALDWGKGPDYIVIGLRYGGSTGKNIQVYSFVPGTLTLLATVSNIGLGVEAVSWAPNGICFAASTEAPSGYALFETYSFNGSTLSLITTVSYGNLSYSQDFEAVRWSNTGKYIANGGDASGIVGVINLYLYGVPGSSCYTWTDLIIEQASNTFYHDMCVTFTGNSIWTGRGAQVEFDSTCVFYLATNASLMFRDMTLVMDGTNLIVPVDSTSTLSFNNVTLVLENNYTFSLGRLDIIGDVIVQGEGNSFIFSSTVAGHIHTNSHFIFDANTTFSYAPYNSSRTNLIFDDNTGRLVFNSATLFTSSVGLQLTQGNIWFDGLCMVINQGNSSNTSLKIGDGASSANNVTVRWLPACNVNLMQGIFEDNNV